MKSGSHAHIAIGWLLVVACGRIGFNSLPAANDAPIDTGSSDGQGDAAARCDYIPNCMPGQVTCCTSSAMFCVADIPGSCSGTIARCSVFTHEGCPPRFACCITQQRPEASCYDPLFPQPC